MFSLDAPLPGNTRSGLIPLDDRICCNGNHRVASDESLVAQKEAMIQQAKTIALTARICEAKQLCWNTLPYSLGISRARFEYACHIFSNRLCVKII